MSINLFLKPVICCGLLILMLFIATAAQAGNQHKPTKRQLQFCDAILNLDDSGEFVTVNVVDGKGSVAETKSVLSHEDWQGAALERGMMIRDDALVHLLRVQTGVALYDYLNDRFKPLSWELTASKFRQTEDLFSIEASTSKSSQVEPKQTLYRSTYMLSSSPSRSGVGQDLAADVWLQFANKILFDRALLGLQDSLRSRNANAVILINAKTLKILVQRLDLDRADGRSTLAYLMKKYSDTYSPAEAEMLFGDRIYRARKLDSMQNRSDDLVQLANFPSGESFLRRSGKLLSRWDWKISRHDDRAELYTNFDREYYGFTNAILTAKQDAQSGDAFLDGEITFRFNDEKAKANGLNKIKAHLKSAKQNPGNVEGATALSRVEIEEVQGSMIVKVIGLRLAEAQAQKLFATLLR